MKIDWVAPHLQATALIAAALLIMSALFPLRLLGPAEAYDAIASDKSPLDFSDAMEFPPFVIAALPSW